MPDKDGPNTTGKPTDLVVTESTRGFTYADCGVAEDRGALLTMDDAGPPGPGRGPGPTGPRSSVAGIARSTGNSGHSPGSDPGGTRAPMGTP